MSVSLILRGLGICEDVRLFFEPHCRSDGHNLVFTYGDELEVFGVQGHRIPAAVHCWMAGNVYGKQVFICSSAMEAIAFLSLNKHRFNLEHLLFISVGLCPVKEQVVEFQKAALVFGRDVMGRLLDIKVAAMLNGQEVKLWFEERFRVKWRNEDYLFEEAKVSLNAFEKASGFRSGCRTYKAKGYNSFLEQLLDQDGKIFDGAAGDQAGDELCGF